MVNIRVDTETHLLAEVDAVNRPDTYLVPLAYQMNGREVPSMIDHQFSLRSDADIGARPIYESTPERDRAESPMGSTERYSHFNNVFSPDNVMLHGIPRFGEFLLYNTKVTSSNILHTSN